MSNSQDKKQFWQFVNFLRQMPQQAIDRLALELKANLRQQVKSGAESHLGEKRIEDLAPIANRQHSPKTKAICQFTVVVVGSLTFSAGTQVLTSRLGALGTPAAIAGAAVVTYLVDDRATKTIAKSRIHHDGGRELKAIELQNLSPVNEFDSLFYESQIALIQKVEGKYIEKQLPVDGILAGVLSAGEFTTALWIVMQLGLPGGLMIEAIAASIPVAFIWIAAAYQSDRFELPQYYADLIAKYLPYLFPSVELTQLEAEEVLADKEAEEKRCKYLVKYYADGDKSGRLKNVAMAEADYDLNQIRQQVQQIEAERDRAKEERWLKHRQEVAELPQKCPLTQFDPIGTPEEIKQSQLKLAKERQEWIDKETAKLESVRTEDLKMIFDRSEAQIKHLQERTVIVQEKYDRAYEQWQTENQE
ncbi:hypothetical protein [Merismopedia glauca]|uniref:Uncharacterized protein n=1 Tax=Merismopedia glauca CCAP 1448/3 TaxID=1296344 RepID=A0A2T1BXZ8_9CYAN|nr:hypothetical protein [Merismopedia glauca]PSB00872.1 hypothetical protein C7B64_21265 [Merismopedia glauca CCAP 1448/3]